MDHKREHRTPPLARVMGVGRQQQVIIVLHWLKIKEWIVYKILILTFKAFIDRTASLYLCELIKQQIHGWHAMLFC